MKIRSRRRVINLGSGNDDGGKKDRAMRGAVEVVVQGQIEINLRGLCKGRWNNSESGAARSYKLANKRRPHNSASCNGYKWRFSSPPASSPSPLRSTYLELNEETEKERERQSSTKRRLGNTGVTIDRFEKRIDRKFSVPKHPVFPLHFRLDLWPAYTNFLFFRSSCERANVGRNLCEQGIFTGCIETISSNSNAIFF